MFFYIISCVGLLSLPSIPAFAQSSSFMPKSPVPSLWAKSAKTMRSFLALTDPNSIFASRVELAVKTFWRDLINEPYASVPGSKAFAQSANSVVYIITNDKVGVGLIINKDGLILTDSAVIKDATSIAAVFRPKSVADLGKNLAISADVVKINPGVALAALQLRHPPGGIQPIMIGNLAKVAQGDQVFSIGLATPKSFVYTNATVIETQANIAWSPEYAKKVKRTPLNVKPIAVKADSLLGIYGGPLLNKYGAVIGMKTFYDSESSQTYATPITAINAFLNTLSPVAKSQTTHIDEWAENTLTNWRKNNILKQFDTDNDGIIDRIGIDSDQNNYVDAWIVDRNQNGIPDFIARDIDKNGRYEKHAFDAEGDGSYETHYFDHNNDGIEDVIGTDLDEDGSVDVFAIIRRHGLGSTNIKSHAPPPPIYQDKYSIR